MARKLSAISNCSDVSNLSVMLGMDVNDFRSTIKNILGKKIVRFHEFFIRHGELNYWQPAPNTLLILLQIWMSEMIGRILMTNLR